jgi:hypothetical protein
MPYNAIKGLEGSSVKLVGCCNCNIGRIFGIICKCVGLYILISKFLYMSEILKTIKKELLRWPEVTAQPHKFGGIEFRLNKKEMGHIHGDRVADLPFPMDVRNKLVNSGRVSPHHFLPQSGWVSYWLKAEQNIPDVIELFKMRYDSLKPNTKLVTRTI